MYAGVEASAFNIYSITVFCSTRSDMAFYYGKGNVSTELHSKRDEANIARRGTIPTTSTSSVCRCRKVCFDRTSQIVGDTLFIMRVPSHLQHVVHGLPTPCALSKRVSCLPPAWAYYLDHLDYRSPGGYALELLMLIYNTHVMRSPSTICCRRVSKNNSTSR